ncbi:hypothetical protein BKA62DRAFT_320210 [Auriculariales sp. MPI-PUGE-AT-0066]|nr:hypothetical protein BKA62DRAFT_320210 [Auriculariales sp. MPI-PUGE-AT-0066]
MIRLSFGTVFISDGIFCMKMCSNTAPNAVNFFEHIYDTQGCGVNLPVRRRHLRDVRLRIHSTCLPDPYCHPCVNQLRALPSLSGSVPKSTGSTSSSGTTAGTKPTGGSSTTSRCNPSGTSPSGSANELVVAGGLWVGMLSAVVAGLLL